MRASLVAASLWVLCLLCVGPASAAGWRAGRSGNGVEASFQPGAGGEPAVYRAVTTIDADVLEVLAVLNDDRHRAEWMARCVEARLVSRADRWSSVHYSRLSAPWPLAHRDVIVSAAITVEPDASAATIAMKSISLPELDRTPGVVRITSLVAQYALTRTGDSRSRLEYQLAVDLGGRLPATLTHGVREQMTFETLRNLRRFVPNHRDQYAELVDAWRSRLADGRGEAARLEP